MTEMLNPKLAQLTESITLRTADIVREIERTGQQVIKLQTGDPDFTTHPLVTEAAHKAILSGQTHYSNTRGLPELREAIAAKLERDSGLDYDPASEILVSHGGVHAIFGAIQTLVREGDEVLILDPSWMPYTSATIIAGGVPVRISTDGQYGFGVSADQIAAHITPRTRVLILNTPCNPTGTVIPLETLREIAALVEKHNLFVIADEVYEKLVYDGHQHVSFASLPGMRDRTVTAQSFSKSYAMSGWRLGYLTANREIVSQILKVSQYSITNVAAFVQLGGVTALTHPEVHAYVREMHDTYATRRKNALNAFAEIEQVKVNPPQGAFYFMIDISRINPDSAAFATQFLQEQHVAVVPGAGFGACGEGYVRMTFAASESDILEGIERLKTFAQTRVG